MDTSEREDKALSLEETLLLLDAYPTRLSPSEAASEPAEEDPDPAAIDAAMQMLVESGWTFEGVEAAPFDANALAVSTHSTANRLAGPLAGSGTDSAPSAHPLPAPASVVVPQSRIPVLADIDMLLRHQRGRKREQLIQLRAIAQTLEGRLQELRQASRMRTAADSAAGRRDDHAGTHEARVWQQIAERQYEARRRVEQENARLRASLQEQIEVARRLERLLKR